jgi:hypothetical protein
MSADRIVNLYNKKSTKKYTKGDLINEWSFSDNNGLYY